MTSTTQPMQPLFKREHTVTYAGLITPNESMSTAGTTFPKQESPETSDNIEGLSTLHKSHHGLMISQELDEGYQTQVPDRRIRSNSRTRSSICLNIIITFFLTIHSVTTVGTDKFSNATSSRGQYGIASPRSKSSNSR